VRDKWTSKYEYNQRDAAQQVNLLLLVALHVSGDVFTHHQEHLTVFTAFGNVYQRRYRLVSWTPAGNDTGDHYQKL
jgi:hypothetical protein